MPPGEHGTSSHVSGGWRVGDHPGGGHGMSSHVRGEESGRSPRGGHGMSSHVSGGRRVGDYPGGTWDELPCEWGVEWEGGA